MKQGTVKTKVIKSFADDEQDYFDNLIRLDRDAYRPNETGKRVHMSLARTRILRGGLGCLRESSRVVTDNGIKAIGEIDKPTFYLSYGAGGFRWSRGTKPFIKGKAKLFRVLYDGGEFFAEEHHRVLCDNKKYKAVKDLTVNDKLFGPDKLWFGPYADSALKKIILIEEGAKEEWYWDLQVPGDNNYVAEGVVHHNSGKSRTACEQINDLALSYPGATLLIGRKDMTSLKETTQKEFLEKVVDSATIDQFNVNDNKLFYKNSSSVLFRETKFPDKVKSMELTGYLLDEADENETPEIWEKIDERLRQKIRMNGEWITPPYCGIIALNPTHDQHWIYALAQRKDISLEDFRFSTYENLDNLPPDYIPNLLKRLAPWDVDRLIHGHWGRVVKGLPVFHGFRRETHVKKIKMREDLPLLVGWDFGFNKPAITINQMDPVSGRFWVLREFLGSQQMLQDTSEKEGVVTAYRKIVKELIGPVSWPIFHYGDPHGNDKKDSGLSSIEYLRVHHNITVASQRSQIKTGIDEIQHKISTQAPVNLKSLSDGTEPLFMVDASCKNTILALEGGYHRDPELGTPVKDGEWDHLPDTLRYVIVNTMGASLKNRFKTTKYQPRNKFTGY